jgi:hypothetical protein
MERTWSGEKPSWARSSSRVSHTGGVKGGEPVSSGRKGLSSGEACSPESVGEPGDNVLGVPESTSSGEVSAKDFASSSCFWGRGDGSGAASLLPPGAGVGGGLSGIFLREGRRRGDLSGLVLGLGGKSPMVNEDQASLLQGCSQCCSSRTQR